MQFSKDFREETEEIYLTQPTANNLEADNWFFKKFSLSQGPGARRKRVFSLFLSSNITGTLLMFMPFLPDFPQEFELPQSF